MLMTTKKYDEYAHTEDNIFDSLDISEEDVDEVTNALQTASNTAILRSEYIEYIELMFKCRPREMAFIMETLLVILSEQQKEVVTNEDN